MEQIVWGKERKGSVTVAKNVTATVILNGLTLTEPDEKSCPIWSKGSSVLNLVIQDGTTNVLTDADHSENKPKACVNAAGDVNISGKGSLTVNGNNKNGIKADGNITISDAGINVNALDNGISADTKLTIESGEFAIVAGGDALKSAPEITSTSGSVSSTTDTLLVANSTDEDEDNPDAPSTDDPDAPSTDDPNGPSTDDPDAPSTDDPSAPSTDKPVTPGNDNSNTGNTITKEAAKEINGIVYAISGDEVIVLEADKSIKKAVILKEVSFNGKNYPVTQIAKNAFNGCTKLSSVTINASLSKIGAKAFYKCSNLKKITFKGKTVPKIGSKAFKGIYKKAVIKVPKKAKTKYVKALSKKSVGYVSGWKIK